MSLYKDASLVMIPSAYKDGKLYSIRPTDGSGDFTFSRGSNLAATRVDVNGLIEKGRENLLLQSNQFDTTWQGNNAVAISGYADRNGGTNAWLLREQGGNIQHWIRQSSGLYSGIGTFSFYAKKKDYDWIQFARSGDGGDYANFNISNGTLGNVSGGSIIDRKIESVGNGWYRCSVTYSFGSNSFVGIALIRSDVSTRYEVYQGDNTSGTYIQDAQVEQGLVATDYIETGTSAAQSGILEDMPRLDYSASCPSLLLEPQRSNLVVDSEYFDGGQYNYVGRITRTPNAAISPEGLQNAYAITETTDDGTHLIGQASWNQNIENTSVSVFAKSNGTRYIVLGNANMAPSMRTWFDLEDGVIGTEDAGIIDASIEPFGNGWYRCSITYLPNKGNTYPTIYLANSDGGTLSYVGDGVSGVYLYGYQIEYGSYPTSYIPTYGTSQTRSEDQGVNTLPDALEDNFTIFVEMERLVPNDDSAADMMSLYGGGSSRIRFTGQGSTYLRLRFYPSDGGNSTSVYDTSGDFAQGNNYKIAIVYQDGVIDTYANGAYLGTANRTLTATTLYLRQEVILKQFLTFPTALTDSECIALTTL